MKNTHQKGFTLLELMIALFIGGLVIAGASTIFRLQQDSYIAQEEIAEMQQELRSSLEIMSREIRNAGHDLTPTKSLIGTGQVGFLDDTATPVGTFTGPFSIHFAMDIADALGNPTPNKSVHDPNEDVAYALVTAAGVADPDGIADAGVGFLGRDTGGGLQPLCGNIHAIGFAYARDSGAGTGAIVSKAVAGTNTIVWAVPTAAGGWYDLDDNNDGIIDEKDIVAVPPLGQASIAQLTTIRAVRIWVLARTSRTDLDYTDTNTYKVGANIIGPPGDNFRRRVLSTNVRCRNMGIQAP